MKKVFLCIVFHLMFISFCFSQKEGDQWVFGYDGSGSPELSIMNLDFRSGHLDIILKTNLTTNLSGTASNICNSEGEPILWTNGMEIFGRDGVKIADTIAHLGLGNYWNHFYSEILNKPRGFPVSEGAIILPSSNIDDTYSVIYHSSISVNGTTFEIDKILEAKIHVENDSSFTLMYKDSLIGEKVQFYSPRIEAVRHGNGRDWWIVTFEERTGLYFSYILGPEGIWLQHSGTTEPVLGSGGGAMSSFSPNGNFFARMDIDSPYEEQVLTLYSFDRCSGVLEILDTFKAEIGALTAPCFSPSERYLYGNNNENLWQWDLWAEDIAASKTLVDTFDGFIAPGFFAQNFGQQMAAPDGRIYIIPTGSSDYMHVIERPNLQAKDCKFLQHHIKLPAPNTRTAPNIPNFRLGPLDGSPCDTLGIDNIPVSRWRYEEDEPGWYHDIRFTDLSFYDPQTWYWDFGDGKTSDEPSPVHSFEDGLYHVCLTVSNANGTDSTCQWIEILPTGTHDASDSDTDLSIRPNPFDTELIIESKSGVFRTASFHLFDMYGRLILHQPEIPIPLKISLPSLPSGMYLCRIEEADGTSYSFKVMKQ